MKCLATFFMISSGRWLWSVATLVLRVDRCQPAGRGPPLCSVSLKRQASKAPGSDPLYSGDPGLDRTEIMGPPALAPSGFAPNSVRQHIIRSSPPGKLLVNEEIFLLGLRGGIDRVMSSALNSFRTEPIDCLHRTEQREFYGPEPLSVGVKIVEWKGCSLNKGIGG